MKEFKKPSKHDKEFEKIYSTSDRSSAIPPTEYKPVTNITPTGINKPPPDYDYTHSISVEDPRFELKPVQETPLLMRVQAVFSQDGNTMGTTEDYEDLTITMEYQTPPAPGNETEGFFTLETESGWSIDDPEEIVKLIESVKQAAIKIGKMKNASSKKKN